eukprot:TRINITY_DN22025_c0_g1_i1.p1 TRINITY_DN22025_c0_g1~~TRINITY_DN22025_c0_g1_i1.p1  ORF type:complete len:245 (-),score=76.22 TRINITY_DN22025_c0_g1_i1:68-802(-)
MAPGKAAKKAQAAAAAAARAAEEDEAAPAKKDGASNITSGLQQLSEALKTLAPKLAPCPVPGAGEPAEAVLARLFADEKDLVGALRSFKARQLAKRSEESFQLYIDWEVDAEKRRKIPKGVVLLDRSQEGVFRDLPKLIEFVTAQQVAKTPNTKAVADLVQLFVKANGHDLADSALLQDAISVSYAMFVVHNELRLTEARGSKTLKELLGGSPQGASDTADSSAKTASAATPVGTPKKKKRKTK